MVKTVEVETTIGTFEIKKPAAGVRNRALIAAEGDSGVIKQSLLMITLLPKCINKRPEGADKDVPISQLLDSLEIEDYDELIAGLSSLIEDKQKNIDNKEIVKKS